MTEPKSRTALLNLSLRYCKEEGRIVERKERKDRKVETGGLPRKTK